jgi:hypothetical protein
MAKTHTTTEEMQAQQKKAYLKPTINIVQLVPEEAVLGNCKTGLGFGVKNTCEAFGETCTAAAPTS